MAIRIRGPDWNKLNEKGIPDDSEQVMEFFNKGIDKKAYPYIPRKTKITEKEIKELWMPSKDKNITYLAEIDGKIRGSGTVFLEQKSNQYSVESKREVGEYALSIEPDFLNKGLELKITEKIIETVKKRKLRVTMHTSIDNKQEIGIMQKLGYKGKLIENYERYAKAGLNPKVYEYIL